MRAFHDYIVNYIETELPIFKTVKLNRGQEVNVEELLEEHFFYPAVLVSYNIVETRNLAFKIKDHDVNVTFNLVFESYRTNKLDKFELVDTFANAMQGFRAIETDAVQFSTFEEIQRIYDAQHDQIIVHQIDFSTVYRNIGAYNDLNTTTLDNINTIPE